MVSHSARPRIVVGVDGSPSALHAVGWAADEANRRRLPLRLVHAMATTTYASVGGFVAPPGFFQQWETEARQYLADAENTARQAFPALEIEADLKQANAAPVLIEESKTALMVVLGSRGLGGFTGMLAGSTAVATAAHGHCPIAVIRGRQPDQPPPTEGPVVVGIDGSPASEKAVAIAFEEASLRSTELVAVHTWTDYTSKAGYARASLAIVDWSAIENQQALMLAERLAGWQEKYPDVRVHRFVEWDRPVRHLLARAADAQLLVVGSRGRGGITGMLLGSTSQALIYHTPCPLLVARPNPER